jgi:hypothetical protein
MARAGQGFATLYALNPRSRKKKAGRSSPRAKPKLRKDESLGLWIAPDLERRTKGEEGRRGLSEPPYAYYLQLADLAMRGAGGPEHSGPGRPTEASVEPIFTSAPAEELPPFLAPVPPPKPPKLALPKPAPLKPHKLAVPRPPKLALPKPPQARSGPKPPKRTVPKPPRRRHL